MNEIDFRLWLKNTGRNNKLISDTVSRIKRVEREFELTDIDIECEKDQCEHILSLFTHTGRNNEMEKYNTSLPIGKYSLNAYKYAINLYRTFYNEQYKNVTDY